MADVQDDAAPQAVDRKELLAQQFSEVEQTATAEPTDKNSKQADASQGSERPRDAAGKFTPKTVDADRFSPTYGKEITAKGQAAAAPVELPEPQAWDKAPASWKKDKHPLWDGMTPEQRQYAFEREQQMKSGVEPLLPKAELADKITKAAEPYMNTIRGLGIDLPSAVAGLMKVDNDLRTLPHEQKLQVLAQVARGYGIDITGQLQNAGQPTFDPNFQSMQNELLGVKGQLSSFIEQQEAERNRAALSEVQSFAKTAEHFEDVKPVMIQLLQSGVAEGIKDAYEKAIRLDPELSQQIQSAQQAAADAEKRTAADAAAKRAKSAAVSVKSATPGTKTTTNAQDRRSMLRDQLDSLSERL